MWRCARAWFVPVVLSGCADPESTPKADEAEPESSPPVDTAPVLGLEASLSSLDFGDLDPGASRTIGLVVANPTEDPIVYTENTLGASSLTLTRRPVTPTTLYAGTDIDFQITWTPVGFETLDAGFDLVFEMPDGTVRTFSLPATGRTVGLEVTPSTTDFGDLWVGCESTATLALTNFDDTYVYVWDIDLGDAPDVHLEQDGAPFGGIPLMLSPGERLDVTLVFAPEAPTTGPLTVGVESDWPVSPRVDLVFDATAEAWGEHVEEFTYVARTETTTMIVAVNVGTDANPMPRSALSAFFAAAPDDAGYRVAFVAEPDGVPRGDVAYLDATYSDEEAVAIAEAMLTQDAPLDNDALFDTTVAAIGAGRAWLVDESPVWADSVLHLVGVNNDLEQGSMNTTTFLAACADAKGSFDRLRVDGIMGTGSRSGCAVAEAWMDASSETGGTFFDYCADDWATAMASLGELLRGEGGRLALEAVADPDSITVTVDGIAWTDGWTYDEEAGEIVFAYETQPPDGATIVVSYTPPRGCLG